MTPPDPWFSALLSLAVALLGVGGNAVLVAFFLGKLRATQDGFEKLFEAYQAFIGHTLATLGSRMSAFDAFGDASATDRARINVRLDQLERGAEETRSLRDEVMKLSARAEVQHRELGGEVSRLRRSTVQIQRQIASLATGRAGVAFTTEPFGPPSAPGDPQ
jgi:hypothetical protein